MIASRMLRKNELSYLEKITMKPKHYPCFLFKSLRLNIELFNEIVMSKFFGFDKRFNVHESLKYYVHSYHDKQGTNPRLVVRTSGFEFHNENGPALQVFHDNGELALQCFFENGVLHNNHGTPALVEYDNSGRVLRKEYYVHGARYRNLDPAIVTWNYTMNTMTEYWYKNNTLHSDFDPAVIVTDLTTNKVIKRTYAVKGNILSEEAFIALPHVKREHYSRKQTIGNKKFTLV